MKKSKASAPAKMIPAKGKKRQKTASVGFYLDKRYVTKDGKCRVRLRITKDREQHYYPTDFSFTESEWQELFAAKMKDKKYFELQAIEEKATNIITKMPSFSFDEFKKKFENYQDTASLTGAFNSYINELRSSGQIGTAINYECARNSLNKFNPEMSLTDVNLELLKKYEAHMKDASTTTLSMYTRALRTIINKAIAAGEFPQENYPFGRYKYQIPQARKVKKALSATELAKIYNYKCTGTTAMAKDYWMFMFFGHGMNAYDLCLLKYENIKGGWIVYKRKKTVRTNRNQDETRIPYTADLKRIVKKYGQGGNGYVFPILEPDLSPEREKQLVQQFVHVVNDHMKIIADKLKIDKPCSTYYSRHSFNTISLRGGISLQMISKQMGHSSIKTTEGYFAGFEDESISKITEVISKFKKPGKIVKIKTA